MSPNNPAASTRHSTNFALYTLRGTFLGPVDHALDGVDGDADAPVASVARVVTGARDHERLDTGSLQIAPEYLHALPVAPIQLSFGEVRSQLLPLVNAPRGTIVRRLPSSKSTRSMEPLRLKKFPSAPSADPGSRHPCWSSRYGGLGGRRRFRPDSRRARPRECGRACRPISEHA
jgi:hypothetical protein